MTHEELIEAEAALTAGNVKPILGIALRAAFGGGRCDCDEPEHLGRDLMCRRCLRENDTQIARVEAEMRAPHPFEIDVIRKPRFPSLGMCSFCSQWRDDARHEGQGERWVYGDYRPDGWGSDDVDAERAAIIRAMVDEVTG